MDEGLRKRILEIIGKTHLAAFTTVGRDGRPWVRYVMAVADEKLVIRFATFANSRKVEHVRFNPEVHITAGVTDPEMADSYLQIQGRARFADDEAEKGRFWNAELKDYFSGPDDPNYGVMLVEPYRIELHRMESMQVDVWER